MASKAFESKILKELKNLSRDQVVHFAWLCAVRATPFLGTSGNFDFWDDDKQKYLYAMFHALDVIDQSASYEFNYPGSSIDSVILFSPYNSYSNLVVNLATSAAIATIDSAASTDAYSAAYFAALAVTNFASAAASASASDAAFKATNAAHVSIYFDSNRNLPKNELNFESVLLNDIKNIKSSKIHSGNQVEIYGLIWDNFQKALISEGCTYWSQIYKDVFENGFIKDSHALERHMNVPDGIKEQGASTVANFIEELEKGAKRFNEARIIILGDKGSGKTCLARRLINPEAPMTLPHESTPGVNITNWKLEKENINIRIWDFAGHVVTHAVHQFFLSERCLYIIVTNGRFEDTKRLEYWLNHVKSYGGDSKAIILINKLDQFSVSVPINELKRNFPVAALYTLSIQDDRIGLEVFRNEVANYIKDNPSWNNLEIPLSYYKIKEDLERLFFNGKKGESKSIEYITKEDFIKIANKYDSPRIELVLKDLNALGVSLWYKNIEEFNTLILNPEWISNGIYKIINWVNEEKKYSITLDDFTEVFKEDIDRFPNDKFSYFFKLMMHYELAYKLDGEDCLIIPQLLELDCPEKLPDFPVAESLMIRYKTQQDLPPNTISQFIVRHNKEIKKEDKEFLVWRSGVVLDDGVGSIAIIREEDRCISLSVKGVDKTNYISILRKTLNNILNNYRHIKPELECGIELFGKLPVELDENTLWLSEKKIFNHSNFKEPYFEDNTGQFVDMQRVVKVYNINYGTIINGSVGQFTDKSKHIINNFKFKKCNIELQGEFNQLSELLLEHGNPEESKRIESVGKALGKAEHLIKKVDIKKNGIAARLKSFVEDLGNENSKLHRIISGIEEGISIAQKIAKGYNYIALGIGLPPLPIPFIKK